MFEADISKIDLACSKTWNLISNGNTKGCFQLESRLGRSLAKKLKPSNIEELAALISIMRPGCLEAYRDGKSVTSHYIDKKNGVEDIDYFHECLEPILNTTYGEMVYQEQAMQIAKDIAGFDLQEADNLRKAIGKKKPEEMAKLKIKFIDGCANRKLLNAEQADQVFGWIEKSQRYSFNKSHAISYAMNCYLSAYAKAHYPVYFFTAYLRFAKDKIDPQQEIKELVQNAIEMGISVCNPDVRMLNDLIELKNQHIYFGLTDIKGFGQSAFKKLKHLIHTDNLDLAKLKWTEFLIDVLYELNSTASKALIQSGALDYLKLHRNKMLLDYSMLLELTPKEVSLLKSISLNTDDLYTSLCQLKEKITLNKRKEIVNNLCKTMKNPPFSIEDSIEWLVDTENMLLGYSISCSKIDMYDIHMVSHSCRDIKHNKCSNNNLMVAGEIENINIVKTKKGKNAGAEMAFLSINDGTACLDSVVYFPETFRQYRNQLFEGNIIIIKGNISKNKDSFVAEKTFLAKT